MFMAEGLCSDIFSQSGLSLRFPVSRYIYAVSGGGMNSSGISFGSIFFFFAYESSQESCS